MTPLEFDLLAPVQDRKKVLNIKPDVAPQCKTLYSFPWWGFPVCSPLDPCLPPSALFTSAELPIAQTFFMSLSMLVWNMPFPFLSPAQLLFFKIQLERCLWSRHRLSWAGHLFMPHRIVPSYLSGSAITSFHGLSQLDWTSLVEIAYLISVSQAPMTEASTS